MLLTVTLLVGEIGFCIFLFIYFLVWNYQVW